MLNIRLSFLAWTTAMVTCLVTFAPTTAQAHETSTSGVFNLSDGRSPGQPDFKRVGRSTYKYLPGKEAYEVHHAGSRVTFAHVDYSSRLAASPGAGIALPTQEASPICRTSGNRIVVVYVRRALDKSPTPVSTIQSIVKRMNWKIAEQAKVSSGGSRTVNMAVDCSGGAIQVHDIKTWGGSWGEIFDEVREQLNEVVGAEEGDAVKYLIFESESNCCLGGIAEQPLDNSKARSNQSATQITSAIVYRPYWETHTAIHELSHALGAAQGYLEPKPPYATPSHCTDGLDVLCYKDGTEAGAGYSETRCPASSGYETPVAVPIDCGYDTYFNAAPGAGSYLAEYWDVAGPEDPYLSSAPAKAPKATTGGNGGVGGTEAIMLGTVTPESDFAFYQFEYGPTTSYGSAAPIAKQSVPGFGAAPTAVDARAVGLLPQSTYHYRVVASNDAGATAYGNDKTFTTPEVPPAATIEAASNVQSGSATLSGSVNPEGFKTSYQFEYGKTTAYGKAFPASPKEVGSGTEAVKVSESVGYTVEPNTTYHFRLKATGVGGTAYSEDKTFTTPRAITTPAFSSAFGSKGSLDGQLKEPWGAAVDPSGNVWVIDRGNSRIEKFNSEGEYLLKVGAKGKADGQFESPRAIAADSAGNVWVADTGNGRVQKFNAAGEYVSKFGSVGFATDLAIDPAGNVWVIDLGELRIQKFNSKGELLLKAGGPGSGTGQFEEPYGIAADADGNVWVSDLVLGRLQQFDSQGRYLGQIGGLKGPSDVAIDPRGTLWVTSSNKDLVYGVYPEGEVAVQFGEPGAGESQFSNLLLGIASDSEGNLRVVDFGSGRVLKWLSPPAAVNTDSATQIKRSEATLNGLINPQGKATSYQFEWGTTTSYGNKVPVSAKSIGSGSSGVKVAETIKNLKAGTTYYYHVLASSEAGTTYGETRRFSTLAGPTGEAKWKIGGKTLAELGAKEATFVSSGTFTMEIPGKGTTISCTETGSGKVSGTNTLATTLTLNCKNPKDEAHCTYKPITLSLSGTATSLTPTSEYIYLQTAAEECSIQGPVKPPVFAVEVGTEASKVPVAIYGSGTYAGFSMPYTGYSTLQLTGAQVGKTLGYW